MPSGSASYPGHCHGTVSVCQCVFLYLGVRVQATRESLKCLPFLFGAERELILAAALVKHKHGLAWLCLGLCVYVAECKLTCYCFQRGVSCASPIPQDEEFKPL